MEMSGNPAASDDSSAEWLSALTGTGAAREAGLARLHGLLIRVALRELRRREAGAGFAGRELDDLAHQAADDAMLAILGKLDSFRAACSPRSPRTPKASRAIHTGMRVRRAAGGTHTLQTVLSSTVSGDLREHSRAATS